MADILAGSGLQKLVRSANNHCFACGPNNPVGLHLHFQMTDEGLVHTRFVPGPWHEGWEGVIHGGILLSLLDETMAYVLYFAGVKAVTARMETRFRAAVRQGDLLSVEARQVSQARQLIDVEGRILRDTEVVAEANGRFMKLGELEG